MVRPALAGALAVLLALGVAELLAAVLPGVPSPLDAVGQQVVAQLPGGVLTWAIGTFGPANRLVLAVGSVVVAVTAGAVVGLTGRRSATVPVVVVVAVGAVATVATLAQPDARFPTVAVTMVAATASGIVALLALRSRTSVAVGPTATPIDPDVDRRSFLRLAVTVGAVGVGSGVVGRALLGGEGGIGVVDPTAVDLPAATHPLPAVTQVRDLADSVPGATTLITPNDRFFRIDTAIAIPQVPAEGWTMRVHGRVDRELELSLDDLLGRSLHEVDATISCVSNEVGGDLVGTARWTGVLLRDLLEEAGVRSDAEQVVGRSVDGWTGGFPIEHALDEREALVAVAMNGDPLPVRHGFPARLIVPGLYGYVSATKWLSDIELTGWDDVDGYWVPRGWSKEGPVKTSSRIDVPSTDGPVPAGEVVVAGVAWAPVRGVERVQIDLDGEGWQDVEVLPGLSAATWVQWRGTVAVAAGEHAVRVRAIDGDGQTQPEGPATPAPDGAEGWHRRTFTVA